MLRISSDTLYKNPQSQVGVIDDISLQVILLTILEFHATELGKACVRRDQLLKDIDACRIIIRCRPSREEVNSELNHIIAYFEPGAIYINSETSSVQLPSIEIQWADITPTIARVRESVQVQLRALYHDQIPEKLLSENYRLRKLLEEAKDKRESDLLITCSIFEMDEIRKTLDALIKQSRERLYIMVAFYETNVDCLSSYLVEHLIRVKPDFRIIYRPGDAHNKHLIMELKQQLEPHGFTNFYRAFDHRYLAAPYSTSRPVGNLHSKLALSENELLVGSANLTHRSLNWNLETAIHSKSPSLIRKGIELFEMLWETFDEPSIIE